uniref:USP domain-containing protein n=1 Tax=Rhabditophanes sp. KR3021 TaxID=114890 RepID=A0AC35UHA2_9BILA
MNPKVDMDAERKVLVAESPPHEDMDIDRNQTPDIKVKAVDKLWWIRYVEMYTTHKYYLISPVQYWNHKHGCEGFDYIFIPVRIANELEKQFTTDSTIRTSPFMNDALPDDNACTALMCFQPPIKRKMRPDDSYLKEAFHHPCGLKNSGNSCYINCSLQLFYSIPGIGDLLDSLANTKGQDMEERKNNKLTSALHSYYIYFQQGINLKESIDTRDFKKVVDEVSNLYQLGGQQDIDEFLGFLLDQLEEESKEIEGGQDLVQKKFGNMQVNHIKCPECHFRSSIKEPFKILKLSLNETATSDKIENLLDYYCEAHFLNEGNEWECSNCNRLVLAEICTEFTELSDVLFITVKRYIQTGVDRRKSFTKIEYPLDNLCINVRDSAGNVIGDTSSYQLVGLAKHKSSLITSGHYTTLVKYDKRFWYCNDEDIHYDKMDNHISKNVYALMYVRETKK